MNFIQKTSFILYNKKGVEKTTRSSSFKEICSCAEGYECLCVKIVKKTLSFRYNYILILLNSTGILHQYTIRTFTTQL